MARELRRKESENSLARHPSSRDRKRDASPFALPLSAMSETHSHRRGITIALAIVYLVWGTSYLATKIMVTDEPPLVAGGLRFGLAGLLLLAFAWWRSGPPVLKGAELRHIIVMGLLAVLF